MSKSIIRTIKNVASGFTETQILVRRATSNESTGPTLYEMEEISLLSHHSQPDFLQIIKILYRRLNDKGKNWRHVSKSLTVLDYLIKHGSVKCIHWLKENIYLIKTLTEFTYFDVQHIDQGSIIRIKSKRLVNLIKNDDELEYERKLSKSHLHDDIMNKNKSKNDLNNSLKSYDKDLQTAIYFSRITNEEEKRKQQENENDSDIQLALKLSLEEETLKRNKNAFILDFCGTSESTQNALIKNYNNSTNYQQQLDIFGNPIQMGNNFDGSMIKDDVITNDRLNNHLINQNNDYSMNELNNNFFEVSPEPLKPLKTGSKNPFASKSDTLIGFNDFFLPSELDKAKAETFQKEKEDLKSVTSFDTDLKNLLSQNIGVDTYGNIGLNRIPHQHSKTNAFINSSGVGYKDIKESTFDCNTITHLKPYNFKKAISDDEISSTYFESKKTNQNQNNNSKSKSFNNDLIDI